MGSYLKAGDTISGQEAVAKMTIKNSDGSTTLEDMFYAKDLEAKVSVDKTDVRTLGKRGTQHKPNGWSGSGDMTIYYVTTTFRKMIVEYIKKGTPVFFDISVTNDDPASSIGAQTTVLKDCSLDEAVVAKFDTDNDVLDESVSFTFEDVDILDEFGVPTSFGT